MDKCNNWCDCEVSRQERRETKQCGDLEAKWEFAKGTGRATDSFHSSFLLSLLLGKGQGTQLFQLICFLVHHPSSVDVLSKPNMILTWLLCIDPKWIDPNWSAQGLIYSFSKYLLSTSHEPGRHGCEDLVTCLQSSHLWHFSKKCVPGTCRKNKAVYTESVNN